MSHPLFDYYQEDRPWGSFERFTDNEVSTVKILRIHPGKRLSLQKHLKREEFWRILKGTGTIEVDGQPREVRPGDEALIKIGMTHRITAGPEGIEWLEIAFGEFDENDIVRLEDDYGRA